MQTVLVARFGQRILIPVFQALDMIGNIRAAFNELLNELDWMDEPTKALARDKVGDTRLLLCSTSGHLVCFLFFLYNVFVCLVYNVILNTYTVIYYGGQPTN